VDASSFPIPCFVTSHVTTSLLGPFALATLVRHKLFKQEIQNIMQLFIALYGIACKGGYGLRSSEANRFMTVQNICWWGRHQGGWLAFPGPWSAFPVVLRY